MRRLVGVLLFLHTVTSNGWFSQLMEDDDPEEFVLRNVFGDDDNDDTNRIVRPVARAANNIRRFMENSGEDSSEVLEPRIVRPGRVISAASDAHPRSVGTVDPESGPKSTASRFLDTAESLFSSMFSLLKPEQVTWHVVRPDDGEDLKASVLEDEKKESSGESPLLVNDDGDGSSVSDAEKSALERISSFFDRLGSSAVTSAQLTGPHICIRELHKKVEATEKKSSFKECKRFEKALRCVDRQTSKKGGSETTRIQECCDGFDSDNISVDGCNREVHLLSTRDTLALANSSLVDLFDAVGLSSVLDGPSHRTLIVPPNESIDRLKESSSSVGILSDLLANLILEGDLRDYEMENGIELHTLANATMLVSQREHGRSQRTLLNCVPLTNTNVRTSSGLIHYAADSIALSSANIVDYLENTDRFKTFVSLITPDIERDLRSPDSRFTVFAFSDDAFASLPETVRINVMSKSACVKDLIINHIVPGALCSSELEDRTVISLGGHALRVQSRIDKDGKHLVHIGTALITSPDRFTANGVVHVIDDVILLENLLTWRDHLKTYNEPLLEALSDMSMEAEPITIFVPPVNSSTGSLDFDVFALNHVVEKALILNPSHHQTVDTLTNSSFFLGVYKTNSPLSIHIHSNDYRTRARIGCSRLINQSIHACNSVLHFIDKPLPKVEGDLFDLFSTRKDLSRFFLLWNASDVSNLMRESSPITVFAPSDDAMSTNQFNALMKNESLLNSFVRRYIVRSPLCSFDLRSKANEIKYDLISNDAGEVLRPDSFNGVLHIDGAREEEILASNGVVYVLETPIHKSSIVARGSRILPISFADILGLSPSFLSKKA